MYLNENELKVYYPLLLCVHAVSGIMEQNKQPIAFIDTVKTIYGKYDMIYLDTCTHVDIQMYNISKRTKIQLRRRIKQTITSNLYSNLYACKQITFQAKQSELKLRLLTILFYNPIRFECPCSAGSNNMLLPVKYPKFFSFFNKNL